MTSDEATCKLQCRNVEAVNLENEGVETPSNFQQMN